MRIGFGATVLAQSLDGNRLDGIGYYTHELGNCLAGCGVEVRPVVLGSSTAGELLQAPVHRLPGFRYGLGMGLLGLDYPSGNRLYPSIDLYHATDHLIPRLKQVPVVATIMDAIPLAHPEWTNRRLRGLKSALWKRSASWADHVITISEHSKQDLVEFFGIRPERISVTPLGVDARYFEPVDDTLSQSCLDHAGLLPGRFFLFVGTLQPRKNVEAILAAHRRLPDSIRKAMP